MPKPISLFDDMVQHDAKTPPPHMVAVVSSPRREVNNGPLSDYMPRCLVTTILRNSNNGKPHQTKRTWNENLIIYPDTAICLAFFFFPVLPSFSSVAPNSSS